MQNNTVEDVCLCVWKRIPLFQELFQITQQENVLKDVLHNLITSLIIQPEDAYFIVLKIL